MTLTFRNYAVILSFAAPFLATAAKADDTSHDWSGPYVGLMLNGSADAVSISGYPSFGPYNSTNQDVRGGSFGISGLAGYNFTPGPFVLGAEAELGWQSFAANNTINGLGAVSADSHFRGKAKLRGGYDFGDFMPYVALGVSGGTLNMSASGGQGGNSFAWAGTGEIGAEYAISPSWSLRGDLEMFVYNGQGTFTGTPQTASLVGLGVQFGANYKF